jgi:hypothetical protein
MKNRFELAPEPEIKSRLADENTTAKVFLEHYADELRALRSKKAQQIADGILGVSKQINKFHWQAPKEPWN